MRASALVSLLSLAISVCAEPLQVRQTSITLPIAKRINATGISTLAQRDKVRAQGLRARLSGAAQKKSTARGISATNQAVDYVVGVPIGNPPTTYSLLLDTGSSNTWVTDEVFIETSTTVQTADSVEVEYATGYMSGTEFDDRVTFSSSLIDFGQSIGVATSSEGFDDSDGVIGLGPQDLTIGTLSPDTTASIPTITDNLFAQGFISENLISISFEPSSDVGDVNGELNFGSTDSTKFTGSINFAPITSVSPSSQSWGIDQTIKYGTTTVLSQTAGIVDTGTTLTLIATDALNEYIKLTGAVPDDNTGLLSITQSQFSNLQSLFFTIHGVSFEFTANAQIFPRALNAAIGGDPDLVFLIVGDIGNDSGSGLDFINGMTWVERFYVVLDTANRRVGIANTDFTRATTN